MAVAILPPPLNVIDAAAMEQLAGTLHRLAAPVSLELAADSEQRRLIVRGAPASVERVVDQLHNVYRQLDARPLTADEDPACRLEETEAARRMAVLRPSGPPFVSLRTWREFEGHDPLNPLLGAFVNLAPGECALAQLVVHGPAPERWAEPHLIKLNEFKRRSAGERPPPNPVSLLIGLVAVALMFGAIGIFAWIHFSTWEWRWVAGLPSAAALFLLAVWVLSLQKNDWAVTLDVEAEAKLREQAFLAELRLYASAADEARADEILDRLAAAYQLFDTPAGNRLKATPVPRPGSPRILGGANRKQLATLSVREIAGLWHMPVGEALELVERVLYQRLLPLPDSVRQPGGAQLGLSRKGRRHIPVQLSPQALNRNLFIIGKTQYGKTTLMEHLAAHWMRDSERGVFVVDPHGDLVRRLTGLVPPERLKDVILIDLADATRSVGLNLLDVSAGLSSDEVAEAFVDVGRKLWEKNWGPRMLIPLSFGLRALAQANVERSPERQFTVLSLAQLLQAKNDVRENFLAAEVPAVAQPDILDYFRVDYRGMSPALREQVISPVLSKVHAFERSLTLKRLVGQPRSTLNLYEAIRGRKLIFLNLNPAGLGEDMADLIGSLFLNSLRRVVLRQGLQMRGERARVSVVIDEFQKLSGVDFGALLGELQKYGGNFVLGTQALDSLRAGGTDPQLLGSVLAGASTLITFQVNGDDALYLTERDLDPTQVQSQSLIHLPPYTAYVRTLDREGRPLPVFSLELEPPLQPDPAIAERVRTLAGAYTVPAEEADRLYRLAFRQFKEEYAPDSSLTASSDDASKATASAPQTEASIPESVRESVGSPNLERERPLAVPPTAGLDSSLVDDRLPWNEALGRAMEAS